MLFRHMFSCKHVERLLCNVWISNKDFKQYSLRSPKWWVDAEFQGEFRWWCHPAKCPHASVHTAGLLLRSPSDSACSTLCRTSSTTWCLRWWSPPGTSWRTTWKRWVTRFIWWKHSRLKAASVSLLMRCCGWRSEHTKCDLLLTVSLFLLQASNIDDVLCHHTSFLDNCLKDCMLTNPELLRIFSKLMAVCVMFTNCMQVCWHDPKRLFSAALNVCNSDVCSLLGFIAVHSEHEVRASLPGARDDGRSSESERTCWRGGEEEADHKGLDGLLSCQRNWYLNK